MKYLDARPTKNQKRNTKNPLPKTTYICQNPPMNTALTYHILPFQELSLLQLHDLIRLRIDIFVVEQGCAYPELDGRDPHCFHVLGLSPNGDVVAGARIAPAGLIYPYVSIGRVVVHADARGAGHGHHLMRAAMDFCEKQLHATSVKIAAQQYLEEFYTNLGFRTVSAPYLWDGIDHVDMLWKGGV